jgi:hypothetical protein
MARKSYSTVDVTPLLAACYVLGSCSACSATLKKEATYSLLPSVDFSGLRDVTSRKIEEFQTEICYDIREPRKGGLHLNSTYERIRSHKRCSLSGIRTHVCNFKMAKTCTY